MTMHIINGELEGKAGEEILYWAYCYERGSTKLPTWAELTAPQKYSWKMIYWTLLRYAPEIQVLKAQLADWRALKAAAKGATDSADAAAKAASELGSLMARLGIVENRTIRLLDNGPNIVKVNP